MDCIMQTFERDYLDLVLQILNEGEEREGRNGKTKALFGTTLTFDLQEGFPLLTTRKMFYKGVLAEMAAFLRSPKMVQDFEAQGCNYWKQWQDDEHGNIRVDYGNKWIDFHGTNQLTNLIDGLRTKPHDRRHIISGWDPSNLSNLSLPCCHLLYQWYVREDKYLDMMWYQRSADTMIGIPADMILAGIMNILIAREVGLIPGRVKMVFGDTHIYEEHFNKAKDQIAIGQQLSSLVSTIKWHLLMRPGCDIYSFTADDLVITNYHPEEPIKYELKS